MEADEIEPTEEIEEDGGVTMTRRTLLRRGGTAAVGGAAVAGVGTGGFSPVGTASAVDLEGAACSVASTGGFGIMGYALEKGTNACTSVDRSAEQAEADWENWVDFYNRARQINTHDTSQLEQARRDANGMANLARRDAILAIYNEAVAGNSKSDAQAAAEEAVNKAFSETLKGIWNHWAARITELEGDLQIIRSDDFAGDIGMVLEALRPPDTWGGLSASTDTSGNVDPVSVDLFPSGEFGNADVDLPDGSTVSIPLRDQVNTDSAESTVDDTQLTANIAISMLTPWPDHDAVKAFQNPSGAFDSTGYLSVDVQGSVTLTTPRVREPDPAQFDAVNEDEVDMSDFDGHEPYLRVQRFTEVFEEVETIRTNTIEEVSQLVDIHFEAAQNGNISLPEMTASQGLLEAAKEADSFREIALTFRTMGWAVADTATVISFEGEEAERVEVDSKLAWARQDQPDPLPVGSSVNAGNLPGTMYVAYNYEDENGETAATYTVITGEFTIESTEDGSGEVGFEHRGVVDTSMDPTDVQDEFRDTNDAEQDAEEARQDINVESDFSFNLGGLIPDGANVPSGREVLAGLLLLVAGIFGLSSLKS